MPFNCRLILTDFIHGHTESFQFGAAGQEVWRNIPNAVLAHIKLLDLRQTQRHGELSYTVAEKRRKKNNSCLHRFAITVNIWIADTAEEPDLT